MLGSVIILVMVSNACAYTAIIENAKGWSNVPQNLALDMDRLEMNENNLTVLPDNCLQIYPELDTFLARENPMTTVSPLAFSGTELSVLDLDKCPLTHFPDLSVVNATLTRLVLRWAQLEGMRVNIFPKLSHLSASSGNLQNLPVDVFRGTKLKNISLRGNLLTKVPDLNGIKHILEYFDLSYNLIEYVHADEFKDLSKLHTIQFTKNGLIHIHPTAFSGIRTTSVLLTMMLDKNFLTQLPTLLDFPEALKKLSMQENQLLYVTRDELLHFTSLEDLNLSKNPLKALPNIREVLPSLTRLDITFLSIPCCDLQWLVDLKAEIVSNLKESSLKCSEPTMFVNQHWMVAVNSNISCTGICDIQRDNIKCVAAQRSGQMCVQPGAYLTGHGITSRRTHSLSSCALFCLRETTCLSVNYHHASRECYTNSAAGMTDSIVSNAAFSFGVLYKDIC